MSISCVGAGTRYMLYSGLYRNQACLDVQFAKIAIGIDGYALCKHAICRRA